MWLDEDTVAENTSNSGHIRIRHRSGAAVEPYEADNTRNLKDAKAILQEEMNKNVAGEKGALEFDATIFPTADRTVEWQKAFDRPALQLGRNSPFAICGGVCGVPVNGGEHIRLARTGRNGRRYERRTCI